MTDAEFAACLLPIGQLYHMPAPRLKDYADAIHLALGDLDEKVLTTAVQLLMKKAGHYQPKPADFRQALTEASAEGTTIARRANPAGPVTCETCGDSGWVACYFTTSAGQPARLAEPCSCNTTPSTDPHGFTRLTEEEYFRLLGADQHAAWTRSQTFKLAFLSGDLTPAQADLIVTRSAAPSATQKDDINPIFEDPK